jgi:hypothetical protein
MESILKEKINDLRNYLISICESETYKKLIKETLNDMPEYKVYFFLCLINRNNIDYQINDFVKLFCITDNQETRNEIKKHLEWFLNVNGLNEETKAAYYYDYLIENNVQLCFFQETHFDTQEKVNSKSNYTTFKITILNPE